MALTSALMSSGLHFDIGLNLDIAECGDIGITAEQIDCRTLVRTAEVDFTEEGTAFDQLVFAQVVALKVRYNRRSGNSESRC